MSVGAGVREVSRSCLIITQPRLNMWHSDDVFKTLACAISALKMPKSIVDWGLEELEALVEDDINRSPDSDDESEGEVERMLPTQI